MTGRIRDRSLWLGAAIAVALSLALDVLSISVRTSNAVKKVRAFGVERLQDRDVASRFQRAWDTVAALAVEQR